MDLPECLTACSDLDDVAKPVEREANTGTKFQRQGWTNWCWAAVSAMVSSTDARADDVEQCRIVEAVLCAPECVHPERGDIEEGKCCQELNSAKTPCETPLEANYVARLTCALHVLGCLADLPRDERAEYDDITAQIDAGQPIGMFIKNKNDTEAGHFMLIGGYSDDDGRDRMVRILDPWPPESMNNVEEEKLGLLGTESVQSYEVLRDEEYATTFGLSGSWTATYLTAPSPDVGET